MKGCQALHASPTAEVHAWLADMIMTTAVATVLSTLLLTQRIPSSDPAERRPSAGEDSTSRPPLAEVLSLLKRRAGGQPIASVGPISLGGFNVSRTVDLGHGRTAVAISCNLGGGLLAFAPDGHMVAARRTWEQASLQLIDLNQDGEDELITVEKDASGTGIVEWVYHIYRVASDRFDLLWSGTSYSSIVIGAKTETREGFLRFDDLGRASVRLIFVEQSSQSPGLKRSEWVLADGRFKRQPSGR
jgi:hypothetical protein